MHFLYKNNKAAESQLFFVSLLKSQAQNETIWAWDFVKIDVMPTDGNRGDVH